MKKLLFLILIVIGLASCYESVTPVDNPRELTTVKLLEAPKDTMLIVIQNETLYAIDIKSNLVKYKIENIQRHSTPIANTFLVWGILLIVILFLYALYMTHND